MKPDPEFLRNNTKSPKFSSCLKCQLKEILRDFSVTPKQGAIREFGPSSSPYFTINNGDCKHHVPKNNGLGIKSWSPSTCDLGA